MIKLLMNNSFQQVNLYESTWMPPPEYDFRELGPVDRFRCNEEIIQQMMTLEDVGKLNDAVTDILISCLSIIAPWCTIKSPSAYQ